MASMILQVFSNQNDAMTLPRSCDSSWRGAAAARDHRGAQGPRSVPQAPPGSSVPGIPPRSGLPQAQPSPPALPADLQAEQAGVEEILRLLQLAQLLAGGRSVELGPAQLGRLQVPGRGGPLPAPRRTALRRRLLRRRLLLRRLRRALRGEHSSVRPGARRDPPQGPPGPPSRIRRRGPQDPGPARPRRFLTAMAAASPARVGTATTCSATHPALRGAPLPIGRTYRRRVSIGRAGLRPAFPPRPRSRPRRRARLSGKRRGVFPRFAAGRAGSCAFCSGCGAWRQCG